MDTKEVEALTRLIGEDAVKALGAVKKKTNSTGVTIHILPEILDKGTANAAKAA